MLQDLSREELKELAIKNNVDYGKTWGKERFIEALKVIDLKPETKGAAVDHGFEDEAIIVKKEDSVAPVMVVPIEKSNREEIIEALEPFTSKGLRIVSIDDNCWHFKHGLREDSGTMHQPLRRIIRCAQLLMGNTSSPEV